jgi:hypothetical protein
MDKVSIGKAICAEYIRGETLKEARRLGVSRRRVLKRISEGLDALENKVFYDKDRGKCVVGPNMINWTARQKAIDQAVAVLQLKPAERLDVQAEGIEVVLERIYAKRRGNRG